MQAHGERRTQEFFLGEWVAERAGCLQDFQAGLGDVVACLHVHVSGKSCAAGGSLPCAR